jgi:hypothetical protein
MKNKSKIIVAAITACILILGLFFSPVFSTVNATKASGDICSHWEPYQQKCTGVPINCLCAIVVNPDHQPSQD